MIQRLRNTEKRILVSSAAPSGIRQNTASSFGWGFVNKNKLFKVITSLA